MLDFTIFRNVSVDAMLKPFVCAPPVREGAAAEVIYTWEWPPPILPSPGTPILGENLLQYYYREGDTDICLTRAGPKGAIACCLWQDVTRITCYVNAKPFLMPPDTLGALLRFLPVCALFAHFDTLFFHAAQVALGGRGIVFTAPSGTGKSTQAGLWVRERGAKLICNDRTLVRRVGEEWRTYGYPIDGSSPVRSSEVNRLACIVLLAQGEDNRVERLRGAEAITCLMPQLVLDGWSGEARLRAIELLDGVLGAVPVYRQTCTPDERAVACLENRLREDEVI